MEEEILTGPQVAKILDVSAASVNHWLKDGDFPGAYRINPNRPRSPWRIPRSALNAFIEKRRKERGYIYIPPVVEPELETA